MPGARPWSVQIPQSTAAHVPCAKELPRVFWVSSAADEGNPKSPSNTEIVIFMLRFPPGRQSFPFGGTFAKGKSAELDASSSWKLLNFAKISVKVPGCTHIVQSLGVTGWPQLCPSLHGHHGESWWAESTWGSSFCGTAAAGAGRTDDGRGVSIHWGCTTCA